MIQTTSHGPPSYYECTMGMGSVGQCAPPPGPVLHHGELLPRSAMGKEGKGSLYQLHPKEAAPRG